jgi:hypothetical protein
MGKKAITKSRRSAAEWEELVQAWTRSGLSSAAFARKRGISAKRLVWWEWRLARDTKAGVRRTGGGGSRRGGDASLPPKLVRVDLGTDSSTNATCWEIETAGGDMLRVHRPMGSSELEAVLEHLLGRVLVG